MNGEMNKKERRLYWQDVWQRIKKSWVLVLAITLVCGIAIDLLGYMRNRDGNAVHIDQTWSCATPPSGPRASPPVR